jgi:tetratricopeptide (TPR) repeat protein
MPAQNTLAIAEGYMAAGAFGKAEKTLLEAPDTQTDPGLRSLLGEVYGYQLQWDKAIDVYRELTNDYPQDPQYRFRYGGVLAKKAQNSNPFIALSLLGRIKSSFKKTLALDPDHLGAYWALIDLYVSLPGVVGGSMAKAYDYASALKKLSPIDGYLALGYIYEYDGEQDEARKNYIEALKLLDDLKVIERNQLNYQIGKICSEFDLELDRGILHLKEYANHYTVLDGVPLEWAYYRLAKIYRKKSNKDEAMMWIDKSLELSPDLKPALKEKVAIERL